MVNNIRDVDTDRRAGKRTLAVRLGRDAGARRCSRHACCVAFLLRRGRLARRRLSAWLLLLAARRCRWPSPLMRTVRTRTDGPSLNGALADTGLLLAVFSLLLAAGVLAS